MIQEFYEGSILVGIFQSKSEKLVRKLYKLHRELFSAARNALKNDSDFWWNYVYQTGEHIKEVFEQLMEEKGEDYAENIIMALINEQTLPMEHQEITLDKFMMAGKMRAFALVFLVNEQQKILKKWSQES